jgi:excisionase family DNA binding protein
MTLVSTDELAIECGVSPATIRRYARQGAIPAVVSPGGHRRFERADAIAALDELRRQIRERVLRETMDDEFDVFSIPATTRGERMTVIAEVIVRTEPRPALPIMSQPEWEQLEAIVDEQY